MDTKWKKSKRIIGFTSWMAGCLLLTVSLGLFLAEGILHGNVGDRLREVFESNGDYQNTAAFTESMADWLNTFLAMSVADSAQDGEARDPQAYEDGAYGDEAYEDGAYGDGAYEKETYENGASGNRAAEAAASEEAPSAGTATETAETVESSFGVTASETAAGAYAPEWTNTYGFAAGNAYGFTADDYADWFKENPNILYRIERSGRLLYTNDESLKMYDDPAFAMPEGEYNYLLYFDGEKAAAYKDGKEVNLYGDGYYYSDTGIFCAPGYKNFPADPSIRDTKVCMVAPKIPTTMIRRDYSESGSTYYNNTLHSIQERLKEDIRWFTALFSIAVLGALLIFFSLILHKEKKEAGRAVAGVTGKVWYEVKLLFLLGILYSAFMSMIFLYTEAGYAGGYGYASAMDYSMESVTAIAESLAYSGRGNGMVMLAVTFLLGFPVLWLFINDAHYNKKPWKKSLTAGLFRLFRTSLLKLAPGKRLIRRQLLITAVQAAVGMGMILLLVLSWINFPFGEDVMATLLFMVIGCVLLILACQIFAARRMKKTVEELDLLAERIEAVQEGKLTEPLSTDRSSELYEVFRNLDGIRKGMDLALQEQIKSERMKVELIANVSHDIKTPLTSIISYVELLKQEEGLPEHVKEYVTILESKAQRLKTMVQDVFEVSKAASGELPVHMEDLDLGKLLRQTLADMSEQILASQVTVKEEIPEEAVMIHADGERLYRVFQNLIQNALKYSLGGSRVFMTLQSDGALAVASVKNTSREELPSDMDFTERFTRGDKSRSDGGSGLGLSIARSFTEACGGVFRVETIADLFVVTLSFQKVNAAAVVDGDERDTAGTGAGAKNV